MTTKTTEMDEQSGSEGVNPETGEDGSPRPPSISSVTKAKLAHPTGRAGKVSVSMPEELMAQVRERVGPGEFSQYVAEAVARQLRLDLLGELLDHLEVEHGPVPEHLMEEARRAWDEIL